MKNSVDSNSRRFAMLPAKTGLCKIYFKVIFVAVLISVAIPAFGISDGSKDEGPGGVLIRYLDASYSSNYDVAYQQISSKDKSVLTRSKFVSQRRGSRASNGLFLGQYSYRIISFHVDDLTAEVEIEIQKTSFLKKLSKYLDQALITMIGFQKGVISEARAGSSRRFETLFGKSVKRYRLHKENDGWKVFLGLKKQESPSIDAAT